ncbi:MAG: hypothetical protein KAV87_28140 [Desulfobacteraceae bacterium]|nr:hypothetical protein [Desulfobacteraceae bacterium]
MITYNCYSILEDVRRALNEYSTALVQGTDEGKYNNDYLLRKINDAYRQLYALLANYNRLDFFFYNTISLTGINSVYTLPGDYGALVEFRDPDGFMVYPVTIHDKSLASEQGTEREYYRSGNTLVLNDNGSTTDVYSLYYKTKCRDLTMGQAAAGGAASITLATSASKVVDFYNGQQIENNTQDWLDTISDYATTRVATISETAVADDWYGTVPEIPEPFMHLIAEMAVIKVKAQFSLAQSGVSPAEASYYDLGLADLLANYGNTTDDVPAEEVFEDVDDDEW